MIEHQFPPAWEDQLAATARAFAYPPTPNIALAVRERLAAQPRPRLPGRRLAWAMIVLLVLTGLLSVPQVRAKVRQWLRIGTVQITLIEPTPTSVEPQNAASQTATPGIGPTPTLPARLQGLQGETTLEQAQRTLPFTLALPTEPADLGPPDRVFLPEPSGHVAVLVWVDPQATDQITLSLHILDSEAWVQKMVNANQVNRTNVHGQPAIWLRSTHDLYFFNPDTGRDYAQSQVVTGNVLIWAERGLTYRLETSGSLAQAQRIAESLR